MGDLDREFGNPESIDDIEHEVASLTKFVVKATPQHTRSAPGAVTAFRRDGW